MSAKKDEELRLLLVYAQIRRIGVSLDMLKDELLASGIDSSLLSQKIEILESMVKEFDQLYQHKEEVDSQIATAIAAVAINEAKTASNLTYKKISK